MTEIPNRDRITQLENSLNEAHRQRALAEQMWRQDNATLAAEVERLREVAKGHVEHIEALQRIAQRAGAPNAGPPTELDGKKTAYGTLRDALAKRGKEGE